MVKTFLKEKIQKKIVNIVEKILESLNNKNLKDSKCQHLNKGFKDYQ